MSFGDASRDFIVEKESGYFEKYLDFIRATIQQDEKQIRREEEKINKVIKEKEVLTDEDDFMSAEDYLITLFEDHEQLEKIMYRSFVISIFALVEANIVNLCRHIKKEKAQSLSYTDLSGPHGIGQAILYIKNVLMLNRFPTDPRLSFEFDIAYKVRNCLVHNEGKVKSKDRIRMNEMHPNILHIDQSGEIIITFEYAKLLIALNKDIYNETRHYFL